MGKIRIRTGRGTGTREVDDGGKDWAGDAYKKCRTKRKNRQQIEWFTQAEGLVQKD